MILSTQFGVKLIQSLIFSEFIKEELEEIAVPGWSRGWWGKRGKFC